MNLDIFFDKSLDLLITFIGVTFGSYLAYYIAQYQLNQQTKQEKQKNNEIVNILLNRCKIELRDNGYLLKNKLIPIYDLSYKPHELHYEWIKAVSSSFQRAAYDDLLRLNLSHNLPKRLEGGLSSSYEMLTGLQQMIEVGLAGFKYQDVYGGTPDYRQTSYDNIKTYSQTILKHMEYEVKEIYKFTEKQKIK